MAALWLPASYIEGPILFHDEDRRASSLRTNHSWNFEAFDFPLSPQLKNLIQGIPVTHFTQLSNSFIWPHNNGICLVKSASKFLFYKQQVPFNKQNWNWIWSLQCPKKIQTFIWKAMCTRLPIKTFLTIGCPHLDSHCPRCHTSETTIHSLHDCPWTKEVWSQSPGICSCLSFIHPYKIGSNVMQLQTRLYYTSSFLDGFIFPLLLEFVVSAK